MDCFAYARNDEVNIEFVIASVSEAIHQARRKINYLYGTKENNKKIDKPK
jgi:hypothetical protein